MPYRTPDEEAVATRASQEQSAADEATRFAKALRKRRFPKLRNRRFPKLRALPRPHPFLVFLVIAVSGIFGGCHAGALISEQNMAGGFVTVGRVALGGSIGGFVGLCVWPPWSREELANLRGELEQQRSGP